jgi:hypothetical protein
LSGFYLAWGTNSGMFFATNTYPATQTNGTISNLVYSTVYYIAVSAFASNGLVSPYSSVITFSNGAAPAASNVVVTSSNPPPPPPPPGGSSTGSGTPPPGTGSGTGTTSGSSSTAAAASTNVTQAQIWGIPPVLNLTFSSNGQPNLNIGGTVGATVMVESTTNLGNPFSWTPIITNVNLTNIAPMESNTVPGQPQDAIDLAYVPAAQATPLPTTTSSAKMQFFRVVMPYDYIILADMVLPPKGYPSRLIVINMPGLNDDACYVSQAGSFIHYDRTNSYLQLEGSGSTIRQIAATLAGSLSLDWTTASEFIYTNGVGEIMATVVETEPASSDPVAGTTPVSTISINF